MDAEEVIAETRRRVAPMAKGEIEVRPINKGGSDRTYARLSCDGAEPLVFMAYTDARPDNAAFLDVSEFLAAEGVRVPKIVAKDLGRRFLWIEDLGEDDLWAHRDDGWDVRRELYRKALTEVAIIHRLSSAPFGLQPPFDEGLYRWEQEYFLEQYVGRFLDASNEEIVALLDGGEFELLREGLAALPRSLVHRDFQSENVMVRDGEVFLIDYQGLRFGRPEYDLASLLYDPYVELGAAERDELLRIYFEIAQVGGEYDAWLRIVDRCAAQRLMQALGAYGKLGAGDGKAEFLAHIPVAKGRLVEVLGRIEEMDPVRERLLAWPEFRPT